MPGKLSGLVLMTTFQWLPHHPHTETDRYRNTRINMFTLSTPTLLEQDHHLMHHPFPRVPGTGIAACSPRCGPFSRRTVPGSRVVDSARTFRSSPCGSSASVQRLDCLPLGWGSIRTWPLKRSGVSQTPGPASPWCFHSTSGDVCKLAHRLGADAGACPQAMSGDELNTLQYFSLLAAQHGMLWTNVDLLPGWCWEGSSTDDLNRLGGWLGVMSQSNGAQTSRPAHARATCSPPNTGVLTPHTSRQRGNPRGVRLGTGPPAYVTIKIMRAARRAPVVARAGLVA